jgi:hypothetical protein
MAFARSRFEAQLGVDFPSSPIADAGASLVAGDCDMLLLWCTTHERHADARRILEETEMADTWIASALTAS